MLQYRIKSMIEPIAIVISWFPCLFFQTCEIRDLKYEIITIQTTNHERIGCFKAIFAIIICLSRKQCSTIWILRWSFFPCHWVNRIAEHEYKLTGDASSLGSELAHSRLAWEPRWLRICLEANSSRSIWHPFAELTWKLSDAACVSDGRGWLLLILGLSSISLQKV